VRIASFNIRGPRLEHLMDLDGLVDACMELDADILGLQEVDRRRRRTGRVDQAAYVARNLASAHVFAPTRHGARGRYGNALVVRGEIRGSEVRVLHGSGTQQPRSAALARVEVRGTGLSVAVTHLQHHPRRLAHLPDEAPDQLRALLHWLAEWPAPWVLIGDLNLQPPRAEPILRDAGFTIAPTGPAYPSDRPATQLDYIAVSGLVVESASSVPAVAVSDHLPIVVDARAST
jgi:endonuclease/exonuclease/phosphatase family metal-dependent hydrolase